MDNDDYPLILSALDFVDPHDRQTWIEVGMGIRSQLGDQGFHAWDEWSKSSPKYDARVTQSQWRSFKIKPGGITVRTLFYYARQNGWIPDGRPSTDVQLPHYDNAALIAEQRRKQEKAATHAMRIIREAKHETHPYLAAKGFPEEIRLVHNERLVIPILIDNRVSSVQFIDNEGNKKFLPGGKVRGGFYRMGPRVFGKRQWFTEGFATALTILNALKTGSHQEDVFTCFSAANTMIAANKPHAVIIADHDPWRCRDRDCDTEWTGRWPQTKCPQCGMERPTEPAGEKYARKTGRPYYVQGGMGQDLNDLFQEYGSEYVFQKLRDIVQETK